ncbi:uncharacterized protein LOC141594151 [Silene latifolia]|uniref:uncharacterized protein LOC141594151 n=1 Tax=Silene latifolia TaxID=37657 RepID=UPI003D77E5FA
MTEGHVNIPKFGDWEGGEAVQYTEYLDNNAEKTKNMLPGLNPVVPQMSQDAGRGPAVANQEGQERPSLVAQAPAHSEDNLQPGTEAAQRNQAASIPCFGRWKKDHSQASIPYLLVLIKFLGIFINF